MKKLRILPLALIGSLFSATAMADDFTIDPEHTQVGFKVRHLAISTVPGHFGDFSGTFSYDPAKITNSKAEAKIEVKSISTNQTKRDEHLKGEEFFNAQKFPAISFVSKEIKNPTKDGFKLVGDLTIKDVTKKVELDVTINGLAKDPWGKERAAFSATTKLNRKDFGLTWNKVLETGALVVGDEVTVNIELEGIKKS